MSTSTFNRLCRLLALLWLFVAVPVSLKLRPTDQDFGAFYYAGVAARTGHWNLLYPDRQPGSSYFLFGGPLTGYQYKAGQEQLAQRHGVRGLSPFVGLPWNALFFAPLTLLKFQTAFEIWMAVLIVCTFGTAYLAGRSYEIAAGQESRMAGVITLLAACSLLSYRCIRVGNVSPPTALAIAVTAFSLLKRSRRSDGVAAAAMVVGGLLKYATVAVVPVIIAARRWRMLIIITVIGVGVVLGTLALSGTTPFTDFFHTVGASFGGSTPYKANQSVWGLLLRVSGESVLSPGVHRAVQVVQLLIFVVIVLPMFRQPWRAIANASNDHVEPAVGAASRAAPGREAQGALPGPARLAGPTSDVRKTASSIFAATCALICWMLIFSPVFWEHYAIYLQPFWGWLIYEARGAWRRIAVAIAIGFAWLALPAIYSVNLREPFNSSMLWSCVAVLGVSLARLTRTPRITGVAT